MEEVLINISKAAKMLGITTQTLRVWDRDGRLVPVKTIGGHRRYRLSEIQRMQGGK